MTAPSKSVTPMTGPVLNWDTDKVPNHVLPLSAFSSLTIQNIFLALAGMAQWIERQPVNQKLAGSIPCQGTCLGCGPGPWLGVSRRQPINASLPLSLPPFPLSKNE